MAANLTMTGAGIRKSTPTTECQALAEGLAGPLAGVLVYDSDLCCEYANQRARQILGLAPCASLPRLSSDQVFPLCAGLAAHAGEILETGTTFREVAPLVAPDGDVLQIDWSMERLCLSKRTALLIWFVDVTQFVRLEQALRKSRERFRQLVDDTPDYVFSLDLEGRLYSANKSLADAVGRPVKDLIGRKLGEVGLPDGLAGEWQTIYESVLVSRRSMEVETITTMRDNAAIALALAMRPLYEGHKELRGVQACVRDITERWQAQQAAQKSEQQLHILTEKAPVAMLLAGPKGAVYANPAFLRSFDLASIEELSGDRLLGLALPDDKELIGREGLRLWRQEIAEVAIDLTLRRPGGTDFPAHLRLSRVELIDGPAIMAFITDLTERRRAEESRLLTQYSVDHAADSVIWVAREGRVIDASESTWKRLGYSREKFLETTVFDFDACMSPLDWAQHWDEVKERETVTFESVQVTREGVRIPVEIKANHLTFAGSECICSFVRDITDRKEAERALKQGALRLENVVNGVVRALSVLSEHRDPYTAGHQQRVARLAVAIGEKLGLPADQLEGLRIASLLHDIGKIAVPIEILCKPGSITVHEMGMIRAHPEIGFEILKDIDFPWPVAEIVRQHHECLDGSGYPAGLSGDQIMIEARILSVADSVEAMSSHRPYRPALTRREVWLALDENSSRLDTQVVKACRAVVRGRCLD